MVSLEEALEYQPGAALQAAASAPDAADGRPDGAAGRSDDRPRADGLRTRRLPLLGLMPAFVRATDAAVLFAAGLLAYAAWFTLRPEPAGAAGPYLVVAALGALLWGVLPGQAPLFAPACLRRVRPCLRLMIRRWCGVLLGLLVLGFALRMSEDFARGWVAFWFCAGSLALAAERLVVVRLVNRGYASGRLLERVALLGATAQAELLIDHLDAAAAKADGARDHALLGIYDPRTGRRPDGVRGVPVVGAMDDLVRACQEGLIDSVVVCLPWTAHTHLIGILARLRAAAVDVRLCPDAAVFHLNARRLGRMGGFPVVEVLDRPLKGWQWASKALQDYLIAGIALLVLAPAMLIIAAAIKLDSPGPVFFRQLRFGFNNKPIQMLKFRTMYVDRGDVTGERRTVRDDPRVTPIGRLLRRLSLDELPQILNVLKGEMSVVGPRAHAVAMKVGEQYYYDAFHDYAARHRVKPGITGWAQVNGLRGEVDTIQKAKARLEYDLHYIESWSTAFDLSIIALTFFRTPFQKNAY